MGYFLIKNEALIHNLLLHLHHILLIFLSKQPCALLIILVLLKQDNILTILFADFSMQIINSFRQLLKLGLNQSSVTSVSFFYCLIVSL